MDDNMEDEIIYELFTTHAHITLRYLRVTTTRLVELIVPGPGESFKTKMFQPGPFMFLVFLVIVASVVLQSSSHFVRQWMVKAHYVLGLNSVTETTFKTIGSLDLVSSSLGSDNVSWELKDGIVGLYGMQGRRGNMEDRYSIIQDVDVGEKRMSFFGVFDGHGGQYTAEYVKDNLFRNTIEKIKQLRSQISPSKQEEKVKNGNNNNVTRNNSKNSGGAGKKTEKRITSNNSDKTTNCGVSVEKQGSMSEEKVVNDPQSVNSTKANGSEPQQEKASKEKDVLENGVVESGTTENSKSNKEDSSEASQKGSGIENIQDDNSCSASEVPMKKDDTYSNVNIKRNSISNNGATNSAKEKKEETKTSHEPGYIDSYKNINYTRLLTDQIIAVDKQVVDQCKSRTDMSGTTAVIAVLDGELLIIGNVGDSRALKERRRIKEAGGFITFTGVWRVAGILATSRALGDFPLKEPRKLITAEPDVLTFSLRDHKAHFVILATDGLWDVLSNEEAVAFVREHIHEPDFGAKSLTLHAYYRGSQDNITVAILNIDKLSL
ncbi:phosphatase 1L-like [Homarus americanus]|uniref:Phosphatase 1L-like n=1 Tax=Homarus americanus TaxID=6706 RepID=A0A8J5MRH9_HOMAM|nr:phosphatase 1L-like [Homarus americanus]